MHKKLLLICLAFLLVGCKRIDNEKDYVKLVNNCLVDKISTNDVSQGYKFYIPKGIKKVQDYNYNQVFLANDTSIYLYVDIVSYYYKRELNYEKNKKAMYFKEIKHKKKNGYIEISKEDNLYFVKIIYNYAKIETYTTEDDLNKIITLSSIIINSIDYNDKVIEKVLEGDFREFSEITYEVKKPNDADNSFSQYLEEYVQKEKKEQKEKEKLPDE